MSIEKSIGQIGNTPPDLGAWSTYEDVAAYLKISVGTLYRLVRQKKIAPSRDGRRTRFSRAAIAAYEATYLRAQGTS